MEIIISAKDRQAAEANKYASILLEEIDHEKEREERRKMALAKKRDKKKMKKKKRAGNEDQSNEQIKFDENHCDLSDDSGKGNMKEERELIEIPEEKPAVKSEQTKLKESPKKEKRSRAKLRHMQNENTKLKTHDNLNDVVITSAISAVASLRPLDTVSATTVAEITKAVATSIISSMKSAKSAYSQSISSEVAATMATAAAQCAIMSLSTAGGNHNNAGFTATSPKKNKRMEDGWKEVTRR